MHTFDQTTTVIPLWPDGAPGSEDWLQQEQETYLPLPSEVPATNVAMQFNVELVRNIARPTLTVYLPDPSIATGTAVIICPGGVFHFLAIELEGTEVARQLCARGIAAFVLKHRVVQTEARDEDFSKQLQERFTNLVGLVEPMQRTEPLAVADGQQAIKVVRQRAAEWGILPERIGILGFSTGAVVTICAAMQYDEVSRPNFAAPIYPFLSGGTITVPDDAPPLFLMATNDDQISAEAVLPLYSAWRDADHPVEVHIYAQGGHGFGTKKQGLPSDLWIDRFSDWLQGQGFLA